jgi:hypothetical protein
MSDVHSDECRNTLQQLVRQAGVQSSARAELRQIYGHCAGWARDLEDFSGALEALNQLGVSPSERELRCELLEQLGAQLVPLFPGYAREIALQKAR